jgi:DNA modification methylase
MSDSTCQFCGAWKGELGLQPTISLYIDHLMQIFDQIRRVLTPLGSCWVVIGDTYSGSGGAGGDYNAGGLREGQPKYKQVKPRDIPAKSLCMVPERFAMAMIDHGDWILRNKIVWAKPNVMPENVKDRLTRSYEFLYYFAKSNKCYFETQYEPYKTHTKKKEFSNPNGRIKRDVWSIPTRGTNDKHFAAFPEELCKIPIEAACPTNGLILDPFAGRGTVGITALKLGRQFLGLELNPSYVEIAKKNLELEAQQSRILAF